MKLPKTYEPQQYEANIYALWEKSGAFVADPASDKPRFSISMPPPNETGTLSLGHAVFLTLQDIMARYHRLKGEDVLWLPGTDHAALPVNAIIEKKLAEEGTNKHAIGRDAFLERTRAFVSGSRGTMLAQMRAMGASADWSRLRYTLDPALSRAVSEVFTGMYNDGLIYRGSRIVNWDPVLETTISDDEVEYREEKAKLYTFKYGPFEISTARPETKFGDKYVVVHPDDERYKQYNDGDTFETEWINGPITATVIKDDVIDMSFGTGAMTITPWHSQVDFDLAEKRGLDKEQIIDFHGNLLPIAGEFAGMPIAEAREKIVAKLKKKGLLVSVDDGYVHNVATNERGKGVIEPQVRLQWFVDVNKEVVDWQGKKQSLKQIMQSVVRDGDIAIVPGRFEKTYFHWIDNLRDWCVSRQIWWGHRIPVWYRHDTDGREETYVGVQPPTDQSEGWNEWEQDPDTLDTWFSSALWTWSTLIDPTLADNYSLSLREMLDKSPDYRAYHPTSVMETGWDIIFFWVARMILMTSYATGQVPFKTVYLHGMVRAADGKKMSKSRPESVIDPLDVLKEYGTDALRMGLIMGISPGNDQNWSKSRIEANRNFCNKLWNIARYVEDIVGDVTEPGDAISAPKPQTAADHWMLIELQRKSKEIAGHLDNFRFAEAYDCLYHFVWDDFADWYIEASKAAPNKPLLAYALQTILALAHPFAPFVTETVWQTLAWQQTGEGSLLATSQWPQAAKAAKQADEAQWQAFVDIKSIVSESRDIIRSLKATGVELCYVAGDKLFETNGALIAKLARLQAVTPSPADVPGGVHLTQTGHTCWLNIDEAKQQAYGKELAEKRQAQETVIKQLEARLANKAYVDNAPEAVVAQTEQQLEAARSVLENIASEQQRFTS